LNGKPQIAIRISALGGDFRNGLDQVAKAGLAGVRLDVGGAIDPRSLSRTGRREIAALIRGRELRGVSLGASLRHPLDEPDGLEERLARMSEVFQLAADLNLGSVVLYTGNPAEPPPPPREDSTATVSTTRLSPLLGGNLLPRPSARTDPRARFQALVDSLDRVARCGEKTGVIPALDPGGFALGELVALLDSRKLIGCGIHWDPATQWASGMKPRQVLDHPSYWQSRKFYVVGRDWKKDMACECPPGQGDLDWPTMMMELCAGGFSGPIIADRVSIQSPARDLIACGLTLKGMIP